MEKMSKVDELIKSKLNPSVIIKLVFNHTIEELDEFENKFSLTVTDEEGQEYQDNCVDINIDRKITYVLTNKNYLPKLKQLLSLCDVNYELLDASKEFFDMENLTDLLLTLETHPEFVTEHFPDYIPLIDRAEKIIKEVFSNNFTSDDVLDKIITNGIGSLNKFHKDLL